MIAIFASRFLIDNDCGDQPLPVQRPGRVTPVPSTQTSYNRSSSLAGSYYDPYPTHPPVNHPRDEDLFRSYPSSSRPTTDYMNLPHRRNAGSQVLSGGNSPHREGGMTRSSSRNSGLTVEPQTRHSSLSPHRGARHGSRGRTPPGSVSHHHHSSSVPPPSSHHSVVSQPTEETLRVRQGSGQNQHRGSSRREDPTGSISAHRPQTSRQDPPAPRSPYQEPQPTQRHAPTLRHRHNPPPPPAQSHNPPAPRSEHSQPPRSQPPASAGRTNWAVSGPGAF